MLLNKKRKSVKLELVQLLIVSLAVSICVLFASFYAGHAVIDQYYLHSDYAPRHEQAYITSVQKYIDDNQIDTAHVQKLSGWADEQKKVIIQIDINGKQIYRSFNNSSPIYKDAVFSEYQDWKTIYTLHFTDRDANAFVYGSYNYNLYTWSYILSACLAFLTFLIIFLVSIGKRVRYIGQLKDEINILGGGNLEYVVTEEGNDDLTDLAENLNHMREELLHHMKEEERLQVNNRKIVTQLSHDIRTPLTSMRLFTDLLKEGRYEDEKQKNDYIDRIQKNAIHITDLTDQLSQHASSSEMPDDDGISADAVASAVDIGGAFEEMAQGLRIHGFTVNVENKCEYCFLPVSDLQLSRILTNISSNILRYAAPEKPVEIRIQEMSQAEKTDADQHTAVQVELRNAIARGESADSLPEGSGIGLQSVRAVMENLGGSIQIEQEGSTFSTRLVFPY